MSVSGIIEQAASGQVGKRGAEVVTRSTCTMGQLVSGACSTAANIAKDLSESNPDAITAIELVGFQRGDNGASLDYGYVLQACPGGSCSITHTGYGYDSGQSPTGDFGYGYDLGTAGTGYTIPGTTGYGYETDGAGLVIQLRFTISSSGLDTGRHFLTVLVDTGSATVGHLSSAAQSFTTATPGGGGGGGGSGDGGSGGGGNLNVDAVPVSAPTGATAAYRVTGLTQTAGQTVTITTGSDLVGEIVFTPSSDLSDATIDVVHYPADTPPDGVGNIPAGLQVTGFVQITISSGGTSHTITMAVTVPQGQAEGRDTEKAVLIKWDAGEERWVPKGRITLTQNDDGSLSGTGTSDCCSNYAVAFDEEDPEVTLTVPSGTLTGSQTLTAEASDNLQIAKVEFYVNDQLVGTDDSEPFSLNLNTASYSNGDHTVRAVAYDFVDNTAESSQTSSFENEGAPGPGEPGEPGDGGGGGGPSMATILIILVVLAVIGAAGYYFYSQSQKK